MMDKIKLGLAILSLVLTITPSLGYAVNYFVANGNTMDYPLSLALVLWKNHRNQIISDYNITTLQDLILSFRESTTFARNMARKYGYTHLKNFYIWNGSTVTVETAPLKYVPTSYNIYENYYMLNFQCWDKPTIINAWRLKGEGGGNFINDELTSGKKTNLDPAIYGENPIIIGKLIKGIMIFDPENPKDIKLAFGGIPEGYLKEKGIPWNSGRWKPIAKPLIIPQEIAEKHPNEVKVVANFINALYSGVLFEASEDTRKAMEQAFIQSFPTIYQDLKNYAAEKNIPIEKFIAVGFPADSRIPILPEKYVSDFPLIMDSYLMLVGEKTSNLTPAKITEHYAKRLNEYISKNPDVIYLYDWLYAYKPFLNAYGLGENVDEKKIEVMPLIKDYEGKNPLPNPFPILDYKNRYAPILGFYLFFDKPQLGYYMKLDYIVENYEYTSTIKNGKIETWIKMPEAGEPLHLSTAKSIGIKYLKLESPPIHIEFHSENTQTTSQTSNIANPTSPTSFPPLPLQNETTTTLTTVQQNSGQTVNSTTTAIAATITTTVTETVFIEQLPTPSPSISTSETKLLSDPMTLLLFIIAVGNIFNMVSNRRNNGKPPKIEIHGVQTLIIQSGRELVHEEE